MLTNALNASPCLRGGGYGVAVEWAETAAPLTCATRTCVTMAVGAAAYQPMVRAGTVGSALTSACHFGLEYSF